jgi:hypothetical protein
MPAGVLSRLPFFHDLALSAAYNVPAAPEVGFLLCGSPFSP